MRVRPENVRRIKALLSKAPNELRDAYARKMAVDGREWEERMHSRLNTVLKRRSGRLSQSISSRVLGAGGPLAQLKMRGVSAGAPYAHAHEFGATIKPKKPGGALTIPTDDNLTPAGQPRYPSARALFEQDPANTFILRLKSSGKAYIVRRTADDLKFLWRLEREVTLPARMGFFETWRRLRPTRERRHARALAEALRKAKGAA